MNIGGKTKTFVSKHRKFIIGSLSILTAVILAVSGLQFNLIPIGTNHSNVFTIGKSQVVLTIGTAAQATGSNVTDYVCNGLNDTTQFQNALNALVAVGGGKLEVLGGNYVFTATVSAAVNNITIEGVGAKTYFSHDGATPIFSAGVQSGWVFRDFSTDAGGIDVSTATNWARINVTYSGVTYYSVPSSLQVGGANVTRSATYVVAASNAPTVVKAQADFLCDGTADQVQIAAALTLGNTQLSEGTFYLSVAIVPPANRVLTGAGVHNTLMYLVNGSNTDPIYGASNNFTISDMTIDQNGAGQAAGTCIGAEHIKNWVIQNIRLINGFGQNLDLNDCSNIVIENLESSSINVATQIVQIRGASYDISIVNPNINGGANQGIYVAASSNVTVLGGSVRNLTGNTSRGIYFDSVSYNCKVIGTNLFNMWSGVASGANQTQVIGCMARNIGIVGLGTGNAFDIDGGTYSCIIGCVADNVTEAGLCGEGFGQVISNNIVKGAGLGGGFNHITYSTIANNVCTNSNAVANPYGIYIMGASIYNIIEGNVCTDNQPVKTQTYGIYEAAPADNNIIRNNIVQGNNTTGILKSGASTKVAGNVGYVTENSGTATILNGNISVNVNHGLATNATSILLTGTDNETRGCYVTSENVTSFTINVASNVTNNRNVYWRAVVGAGN